MDIQAILYEDEDLLVLNKPAGMRVIQDGYHPEMPSLRALLDQQYGKVFIVHRLDKDTSGVLLIAKNAFSHKNLNTQFQSRQVDKEYHALVSCRVPFPDHLVINAPLRVDGDRRHRTIIDTSFGKPAETTFVLLSQFASSALVKVIPKSGYTHQIRAHALYAGFPLLGDSLYRLPFPGEQSLPQFPRPALHAYRIAFVHPVTFQKLELSCPYPDDFSVFIKANNINAGG